MRGKILVSLFLMSVSAHVVGGDDAEKLMFQAKELDKNETLHNKGYSLSLICEFSEYPPSSLRIYKKYHDNQTLHTRIIDNTLVYHIEKLKCSDMGTYYCLHTNITSATKSVDVLVELCKPQLYSGEKKQKYTCTPGDPRILLSLYIIHDGKNYEKPELKRITHNGKAQETRGKRKYDINISAQRYPYLYYDVVISVYNIVKEDCGKVTFRFAISRYELEYTVMLADDSISSKINAGTTETVLTKPATDTTTTSVMTTTTTPSNDNETDSANVTTATTINVTTGTSTSSTTAEDSSKRKDEESSSSGFTPFIVLIAVIIVGIIVGSMLAFVIVKHKTLLFNLRRGNRSRDDVLYKNQLYENIVENGTQENPYANLQRPETSGRYISKDGLIYITVDHTPVPGRKKPKRVKQKREKPVVYVSLDFDKSGKKLIEEYPESENNNCSPKAKNRETDSKGKNRDKGRCKR